MIIFLYGPDSFRAKEKLKLFKDRFIREVDKSGFNIMNINGASVAINELNKVMATQSFLVKRRMVVIKDILKARKNLQAELLELLKQSNWREGKDNNILIFIDQVVDKRTALFKYLNDSKLKEEFNILAGVTLVNWILKRVKLKGGFITQMNANLLASKSNGDLWALSGEIDKLLALSGYGEIKKEDIEQSSLFVVDDNIFNLTDAIGNKNKKIAIKLINDQLEMGVNAIYLLTMIVRQFRILLQVKAELESGVGDYRAIARSLRLHPFVVQKAIPQTSKYSEVDLKNIYSKLLKVDQGLKLGGENKVLLEMLAWGI